MNALQLAIAWLIGAAGCAPAPSSGFGSLPPRVTASRQVAALEGDMAARLNRDRAGQGLAPLAFDARLADIARAHSLDMREHDFFAHESPTTGVLEDRMFRAGYLAYEMRENLAVAADVDRAEDNLLRSPGHRANIMAPGITRFGIGIVPGGLHRDPRGLTITQVFARPAELDSPAEAVDHAARAIQAARQAAGLPGLGSQPLLSRIASELVAEVDPVHPGRGLPDLAKKASLRLADDRSHGIHGVALVAEALFAGSEVDCEGGVLSPAARYLAVAAARAKDARGRPRVKLLVIIGE